ncbi:signal peptidase I [bacterium]|nr:signal peptidase I [bacterium]
MPEETKKTKLINSSIVGFILDIVKIAIITVLIVWPIHHFIFQPFLVRGISMEPTFENNDYLLIEEISYKFENPQRGDVIVFRSPRNPREYLIKRIIGLPNERVVIKDSNIYIYNQQYKYGLKLEENYLLPGMSTYGNIDIKLKPDEYYVLGDNREASLDSRSFGPIHRSEIVGRVWLRGWPLKRVGKFASPNYNNL